MIITRVKRGAIRTGVLIKNHFRSLNIAPVLRQPSIRLGDSCSRVALVLLAARIAVAPVPVQAEAVHAISSDVEPPSTQAAVVFSSAAAPSLIIPSASLRGVQLGESTDEQQAREAAEALAAQQAAEKAAQAAAEAKQKADARKIALTPPSPITGGSEADVYAQVSNAAVAAFGSDQAADLLAIVQRESGFNPNSFNTRSGACGLFQALPCKKMGGMGVDHQIAWGIAYIKARYGTPSNALAHHQKYGWY